MHAFRLFLSNINRGPTKLPVSPAHGRPTMAFSSRRVNQLFSDRRCATAGSMISSPNRSRIMSRRRRATSMRSPGYGAGPRPHGQPVPPPPAQSARQRGHGTGRAGGRRAIPSTMLVCRCGCAGSGSCRPGDVRMPTATVHRVTSS